MSETYEDAITFGLDENQRMKFGLTPHPQGDPMTDKPDVDAPDEALDRIDQELDRALLKKRGVTDLRALEVTVEFVVLRDMNGEPSFVQTTEDLARAWARCLRTYPERVPQLLVGRPMLVTVRPSNADEIGDGEAYTETHNPERYDDR